MAATILNSPQTLLSVPIRNLRHGRECLCHSARRGVGNRLPCVDAATTIPRALVQGIRHYRTNADAIVPIIAFDLLLIIGGIDYFLGQTTVTVDATGVSVRREWLGAGGTKSYDAATIASIDGATAGENSTSFGVTLKFSDGSTRGPRRVSA
jgi:hypothetical protein